mmetsp:Transcript_22867/g.44390  ORF Transcript_22867/g.44390 Transcript_22867/m.44390 type:complete len:432 (-) Transcript_22867:440-1735(-)
MQLGAASGAPWTTSFPLLAMVLLAAHTATARIDPNDMHRLEGQYVPVLAWWCEDMDHEADPLCNLLFADRHLSQTSDGTQLRGLDQTMVSYKPRDDRAFLKTFAPVLGAFCQSPKASKVRLCSGLKDGKIRTLPGIFRKDPPVQIPSGTLAAGNAGAVVTQTQAAPPPTLRTRVVSAASPPALAQRVHSAPAMDKSASAAQKLWLPTKAAHRARPAREEPPAGNPTFGASASGKTSSFGEPKGSEDLLSLAAWSCRDGMSAVASNAAATRACMAFRELLDALPDVAALYPHFESERAKSSLLTSLDLQRRQARMSRSRTAVAQAAEPSAVPTDAERSANGLLYTLLGMLLAASPIAICYFFPAARGPGLMLLNLCNSCCLRLHLGVLQGKLYHLLSRKNTARREAERVVRSLCKAPTDGAQSADTQEKDSA